MRVTEIDRTGGVRIARKRGTTPGVYGRSRPAHPHSEERTTMTMHRDRYLSTDPWTWGEREAEREKYERHREREARFGVPEEEREEREDG